MIINFILQSCTKIFQNIIGYLPPFTGLPDGITTGLTTLQTYWNNANTLFPVDTVFQILALTVVVEIAIFAWLGSWFTYNKIPGKFT